MAAPGGNNQVARRVIDDLIEFSGETSVDGYMSFFKSQQIAETRELFDTLMDVRDDRETARIKLQGLNRLMTDAEEEDEAKEAQLPVEVNAARLGMLADARFGGRSETDIILNNC
ncbi:hypothetical protein Tco_0690027 [Tanacetum coccineum]